MSKGRQVHKLGKSSHKKLTDDNQKTRPRQVAQNTARKFGFHCLCCISRRDNSSTLLRKKTNNGKNHKSQVLARWFLFTLSTAGSCPRDFGQCGAQASLLLWEGCAPM